MPRRRRPKASPPEQQDPVSRFGALIRESAERERAEEERRQDARQQAREAARAAEERAEALKHARRELERAIAHGREARRQRAGVAEADAAWRQAKAKVIELETGAAPDWARPTDSPAVTDAPSPPEASE